jgi:hypothetical protein
MEGLEKAVLSDEEKQRRMQIANQRMALKVEV